MITFIEDGTEYQFNPETAESNYRGEDQTLIKNLANIESLAYKRTPLDSEHDEDEVGVPTVRQYDPEVAKELIRDTVRDSDYASLVQKSKPFIVDRNRVIEVKGELVKRVYIDDPSEVPPGAYVQEGERGGLFYEETTADFLQHQMETDAERMEKYGFDDDQINEAVETLSRIHDKSNEIFGTWMEFANEHANVKKARHRTKSVGSALEKVYQRKPENYDAVSELDDAHGSEIKVDSIEEGTAMFNAIQESDEINVVEADDKYGSGGAYRAQHIIAEFDGDTVELQIKQDKLSDVASASHALTFKPETAPTDDMETLDEPLEKGSELHNEVEMCLENMADYLEGIETEIACPSEAGDIVQEFFAMQ